MYDLLTLVLLVYVQFMKALTESKGELEDQERNLLSVAYKNVVGSRRNAWRVLKSIEQRADSGQEMAGKYLEEIEGELDTICKEVLVCFLCGKSKLETHFKGYYCHRNCWINIL